MQIERKIRRMNGKLRTIEAKYGNGKTWKIYYLDATSLMQGKFKEWYNNGQKWEDGNFKDGKRHGKWNCWYKNGGKSIERWFDNGNFLTGMIYDPNGDVWLINKWLDRLTLIGCR
jgi:antitoxin component YwqK of YwqJK toxin-antitoxin module